MRRFQFPGIIVAEDRGTDLLPRPGDAEKRGTAFYSSILRQIKRAVLRDGWFHIGFANCTHNCVGCADFKGVSLACARSLTAFPQQLVDNARSR